MHLLKIAASTLVLVFSPLSLAEIHHHFSEPNIVLTSSKPSSKIYNKQMLERFFKDNPEIIAEIEYLQEQGINNLKFQILNISQTVSRDTDAETVTSSCTVTGNIGGMTVSATASTCTAAFAMLQELAQTLQ
ncbi:MAG: hypothetical protein ACK4NN_13340 [Rheinheimera sp.]